MEVDERGAILYEVKLTWYELVKLAGYLSGDLRPEKPEDRSLDTLDKFHDACDDPLLRGIVNQAKENLEKRLTN